MPRLLHRLPFLLGLTILAFLFAFALPAGIDGSSVAFAEEEDADDEDGEDEEKREKGSNLGEAGVPFLEQVNRAIEKGTIWLKNKPVFFPLRKGDAAHWGLIKGSKLYGGGTGPAYRHPAGPTALALYTLLKCGVSPKDPVIVKGFNWLKQVHKITPKYDGVEGQGFEWAHIEAVSSYELSVMILAYTAKYDTYKKTSASRAASRKKKKKLKIRDREEREFVIAMVEALVERRGMPEEAPTPEGSRGWRYNMPIVKKSGGNRNWTRGKHRSPPHANQDLSSTQLACLALFSAHRFGFKVDMKIWQQIIEFTLEHQEPDGPEHERHDPVYKDGKYAKPMDKARGFMYIKGSSDGSEGVATGSMSACGITNLLIAREVLEKDSKGKKLLKKNPGLLKKIENGIWDGLAWLDRNWSPFTNKNSKYGYHIYYLYALERAMDILNKKLCGTHLWYEEGAKAILGRQKAHMLEVKIKKNTELRETVYWMTKSTHEPKDVLDTCFALLFLKRATKGLVPGGVVTGQ